MLNISKKKSQCFWKKKKHHLGNPTVLLFAGKPIEERGYKELSMANTDE